MASRILLSCALRTPMENRQPCMPVSRSRTPNIFMPSLDTSYSFCTTAMCRNPSVSINASITSGCGTGRWVVVPGGVGTRASCSLVSLPPHDKSVDVVSLMGSSFACSFGDDRLNSLRRKYTRQADYGKGRDAAPSTAVEFALAELSSTVPASTQRGVLIYMALEADVGAKPSAADW